MSEAKPKLRELALELDKLSWAEVKAMAIQLDMDYWALSNIATQSHEISDRIVCTMDTWLQTDSRASWKKIVKALKNTKKIALAQEIEKNMFPQIMCLAYAYHRDLPIIMLVALAIFL